jgi:phage terminase large subunit GpA-like protein
MDALNDPSVETVVMMSSAQVGKTEILNNIVGYFVDQDPTSILVVQPTLTMGQAWSKDRLSPMLRDTPCLRGKVKDPRARDSGNTTMHKVFPGGHITIAGSNSPAGLASRPIRIVLADELDRWPVSAGTEGDPLKLAFKRSTTFFNRKRFVCSTPTIKGYSRIESMYEESDKRRFYVPCPDCGEFQVLKWAQVQWPEGEPREACYYCEHCGVEIDETKKLGMVRLGEWRAEGEFRGIVGVHLNELYSPWRSFGEIAEDFLEAKRGGVETLKTWVNTSLGETWEDEGETVEATPLFHRRERGDKIPEWAGVLTAGVDVQGDRLEIQVNAWGKGEESKTIEQTLIMGDPAKRDVWDDLDVALTKSYEHETGAKLKIAGCCIDSGGHHTNEVYQFCKNRVARRVWAIKGVGGEGRAIVSRPSKSNQGGVQLFSLGVDTAKDTLYARLKNEDEGPGYIHFDWGLDEEFFKQLTAEKITTKYVKGRPSRVWVQTRPRNEACDCWVYSYAALLILNANLDVLVDRLHVQTEEVKQPKKSPRRERGSKWVSGWR